MLAHSVIDSSRSHRSSNDVVLDHWRDDRDDFGALVSELVSPRYPGTEREYCDALLAGQSRASACLSMHGYRRVWVIAERQQTTGYFVATLKPGRAIKLGPIVIRPSMQQRGIGTEALGLLAAYYSRLGMRTLYMTVPASNGAAIRLALRTGFVPQAVLRRHFSMEWDELVFVNRLVHDSNVLYSDGLGSGRQEIMLNTGVAVNALRWSMLSAKRGGAVKLTFRRETRPDIQSVLRGLKRDGVRRVYCVLGEADQPAIELLRRNNFEIEGSFEVLSHGRLEVRRVLAMV